MILFANFIVAIARILELLINFILIIISISAISSWISPYSNNQFIRFTNSFTNLFLAPLRKRIPCKGGIDWSFIVLFIIIIFINQFFVQSLLDYALQIKTNAIKL